MADNVVADAGSGGATFATDDIAGVHYPKTKIAFGVNDSATDVSTDDPFPITVINSQVGVSLDNVDVNLTGGGTEATALRVTIASDSTGVLSVDDNGSTLSVDDGGSSLTVDATNLDIRDLAATTDNIGAQLSTSAIMDGTTACTPKFVAIDAASSGDNQILAAHASKKYRVISLALIAAGAVNVRFESSAGGTALTGQMNLTTNSGFVLPFNPAGWFETAAAKALNLELSGAVSVDGCLTYIEV